MGCSAAPQGPAGAVAGPETSDRSGVAAAARSGAGQPSGIGSLAAKGTPGAGSCASGVQVPGIETPRIVPGDSLWRISRRISGEGERYTLIYDATQEQIRDPDLIDPGQVLVLPGTGSPDRKP